MGVSLESGGNNGGASDVHDEESAKDLSTCIPARI